MADARSRADWSRTSEVLALIANVNRDPKKRSEPFRGSDFNPHAIWARKPEPIRKVSMSELMTLIPDLPQMMGGKPTRG